MVWGKGKQLNNGKFVVVGEKPLGSGGFGITYKVARTRDRQLFVIKTLNDIARNKRNFRQIKDDFLNEAHTLAGFKQPNIVKIYPKGFTEEIEEKNELWCMVMEFIEGQNLEEYFEENKEISEIDAIALITRVGEALTYIHQNRYVHRDIKPSNIMLRNCNLSSPVLIDFGLAREFDPEQSLTMDSKLTEHFAPLEQYDLDSFVKHLNLDRNQYRVGAWTDVYALAATLYRLLTGDLPMTAPIRKLSPNNFKPPQQLNPKISDRTNAAILKGMAIEPSDRPQTVQEWLDLLSGKYLQNGLYRIERDIKKDCLGEEEAYNPNVANNLVFRATETKTNTLVVIKTVDSNNQNSSQVEKANFCLKNEAQLLKRLKDKHLNIVRYRDSFEEYGVFYLVTDFIEGENLYRLVKNQGKLSQTKAIEYIKQIAKEIITCHKNNIYHRDIHPSNIVISSLDDTAILIDFKVAANFALSGNPFYQPPKASIVRKNLNTDLYSLAATLYYLVTGYPKKHQKSLGHSWFYYCHRDKRRKLEPPNKFNPDLEDYLNTAIIKGMKFEESNRLLSMQQWLNLLNPPVPPVPEQNPPNIKLTRRKWLKWAGFGTLGVLGTSGLCLYKYLQSEDRDKPIDISVLDSYLIKNPSSEINSYPSSNLSNQALKEFEFDVITVNDKGEEISQKKKIAQYFTKEIGKIKVKNFYYNPQQEKEKQSLSLTDEFWKQPKLEYFTENISIDMVYIPGGDFTIGSPQTEKGSKEDERPQQKIKISGFYMGKYPVTKKQWNAVVQLPKVEKDLKPVSIVNFDYLNFYFFKLSSSITNVSWYDAVEFCARLSKHTGRKFRLPTEAEWEYACRAGTTTPFCFGETLTPELANYDSSKTYAKEPRQDKKDISNIFASYPPNAFGLYEMHGNVWEWCADNYHDNYENIPKDGSAWTNSTNNNANNWFFVFNKIVRGGSNKTEPELCRSASRFYRSSAYFSNQSGYDDVGFRCVAEFD
ncbi:serine/threonine protein kinase (plasmid) [Stanieria cyanosphaera PCC 7437]|uniref:Serine/threonine protein kinase n=1 Tax=Stanieria cyanosphaera (strain ATCC 29371 / PCC 7437) TaxID=111780 RepID=K9Y0I5_STAC7|nr:bifunctional serine/threonine-protein kinase/formylglycine-generating enzyme family protein [Stanieria cyanosphaera]AFZ38253.1 serine/threonine protein kinase [Stanieria cyanosphaera PCC 7437]